MNNDLISREALREDLRRFFPAEALEGIEPKTLFAQIMHDIDNAPTCNNLQGEYVDISKLRLMTVEECAGHTIDYAMGWKACIEWIKGGVV